MGLWTLDTQYAVTTLVDAWHCQSCIVAEDCLSGNVAMAARTEWINNNNLGAIRPGTPELVMLQYPQGHDGCVKTTEEHGNGSAIPSRVQWYYATTIEE